MRGEETERSDVNRGFRDGDGDRERDSDGYQ